MSKEDDEEYICLINEEEQYSIWFAWKEIPLGWKQVGPKGKKRRSLKICERGLDRHETKKPS